MSRRFSRTAKLGLSAALAAAIAAWPVLARGPELSMLQSLEKGIWSFHDRGGADYKVCVADGRELIQLRHARAGCSRFVVNDDAGSVDVQYTCPGDGYGRTSIRKESPTVVQIRSDGIVGGAPFSVEGEARRTGDC